MVWSEKIDNRKYLIGTSIAVGFAWWAGKGNLSDFMLLCGIILGSAMNQWLMVKILGKALSRILDKPSEAGSGWGFAVQIILKLLVLGGFFYALIIYGRHLALYGLLLYTFQLIILVLSIKSSSTFLNKGPPP